jgi:outer membrane protein assembly factor BamA
VAQPSIGYTRDAWGSGVSGGTAISMSDMLGDRQLVLAAQLNGHIEEAQFLAALSDQRHRSRITYAASQTPRFFYAPSSLNGSTVPGQPAGTTVFTTRVQRQIIRDLFAGASRPLNRFNRMEIGVHMINLSDAVLEQRQYYGPSGVYLGSNNVQATLNPSVVYGQPTFALVHDNTLFGFVGPFAGSRTRLQVAPAVGAWQFVGAIADFRRYFFAAPFTLAVRGLLWGRFGRDADHESVYLGNTELMRGYTAGSLIDHECYAKVANIGPLVGGSFGSTGCGQMDQLSGSRIAVTNIELRFPLTRSLQLGFLPIGFPPIEGAVFFDMGLAWQNGVTIKWDRSPLENPAAVRTPLKSWGGSIRANMLGLFIMRLDYTKPLDRVYDHPYWTFSIGPTF